MASNGSDVKYFTAEGIKKMEEELDYLRSVKRGEVAEKIKVARSFGDLSENAEYDEARKEQAFMEGRIQELESILSTAQVIREEDMPSDVVTVGSTVTIYNPATKALEVLNVQFTDVEKGIKRTHPKVQGKTFPIIDKDKMTVTEYSGRLQALVTFTIPADKLDMPPATWEAGDEVRMYYKENAKHQALRFMNITRTNIFKK